MDNFQRCMAILKTLGKSMRYWGRYIDEFAQCFCSLSDDEQRKIRDITPKRDKLALLGQLLGYTSREFSKSSIEGKRRIIFLTFVLIAFENFELDYRDTLLSVRDFFNNTDTDTDLITEEWEKVKAIMPPEALRYLKKYNKF